MGLLDTDPWDDLGNWPADANIYKGMKLSESKMRNEVDLREPRSSGYNDTKSTLSLFGTHTGYHSDKRANRKSDLSELGEGNMLYFKFLKYLMMVIFLSTFLSLPAIATFTTQLQYDDVTISTKNFALSTFGNFGYYIDQSCSSASMPTVANSLSYIGFSCTKGKKLASLQQFGLAYKNQTCTGVGFKKTVKTLDRCSLGSMKNAQAEANLNALFEKSCVGKSVCSMKLEYSEIFSEECSYEIYRRNKGFSPFGPPKVYAIAACRRDEVSVPQLSNTPYS